MPHKCRTFERSMPMPKRSATNASANANATMRWHLSDNCYLTTDDLKRMMMMMFEDAANGHSHNFPPQPKPPPQPQIFP